MRPPLGTMTSIKNSVLRAARWSGAMESVADSRWRRERLLILCYHWISFRDEHESNPAGYVTTSFFRRRLERLRDGGFNVLRLHEALEQLAAGTLPPKSVAITFDDGTRDFAELAVPILREFSMPATIYVTTYYCERPLPVFDIALRYLLWRGRDNRGALKAALGATDGVPANASIDVVCQAILDHARKHEHTAAQKNETLARVAAACGIDFDAFLATGICQQMTPAQIRDLPRDLIDVGLHTHRHRTPRDRAAFVREIQDNRACLTRYLGTAPREDFCYPSGDYWREFLGWLHAERVTSATTCVPGLAAATTPQLLLPRFLDSMMISELMFDAWISGFADFLPRRREYRFDSRRLATPIAASR
jgi:peptidoglycan/xylan/chitin deacetylase (PgdA/CDA1 family)